MHIKVLIGWIDDGWRSGARWFGKYMETWHHSLSDRSRAKRKIRRRMAQTSRRKNRAL